MDFEFFENLSPAEAREYLKHFLDTESSKIDQTLQDALSDGIRADLLARINDTSVHMARATSRAPERRGHGERPRMDRDE
jgi:hypothetical protein